MSLTRIGTFLVGPSGCSASPLGVAAATPYQNAPIVFENWYQFVTNGDN